MKATLQDIDSLEKFEIDAAWEDFILGSSICRYTISGISITPGSNSQEILFYGYIKPKIRVPV